MKILTIDEVLHPERRELSGGEDWAIWKISLDEIKEIVGIWDFLRRNFDMVDGQGLVENVLVQFDWDELPSFWRLARGVA